MSLLGAIVDYFNDGDSAELTTLRTVLASGKMYADQMPLANSRPYCIVEEVSTQTTASARSTNRNSEVRDVIVSFTVFAGGRATGESILDALENAYTSNTAELTISNRDHIGTYFSNRSTSLNDQIWIGVLELRFTVSKSGA